MLMTAGRYSPNPRAAGAPSRLEPSARWPAGVDLSGNLGEDSGGIHPQNGVIAVIPPPPQVRRCASINQSRYRMVGAVRGLDYGKWAGVVACDAGR